MDLSARQVNDVTVIAVSGRIARGEAVDSFRKAIAGSVQSGSTKILVDLKKTEFIDSAGIGVLVAAVSQVKCARCGEIYSSLVMDKCPKCGAGAGDSEMEVNAANGAWTPPWGGFKLLYPSKKIEDLLRVTKLYEAFRIYHDERIAVESF